MKNILILYSLLWNGLLGCYATPQIRCDDFHRKYNYLNNDTIKVHFDKNGDTVVSYVYSNSMLIEQRNYYSGNRLRMVQSYKDGVLFGVEKSLSVRGNPVYPGTFSMGNGSIIKYNEKGKIESIEFWSNYELLSIEYFLKRRIKRVIYSKGVPVYSLLSKSNGTIESKTTYAQDGVTILTTEYFDKNLNVVMTLYRH